MPTQTALLSAAEFVALYPYHRLELVRGQLREMPMPSNIHGEICARLTILVGGFALRHKLGRVMCNDSFVQVAENPDSVFGADVLFISYARQPKEDVEMLALTAPELVFEVKSPSESWTDLVAKSEDYLKGGVEMVVLVDPETRGVVVARRGQAPLTLEQEQHLTFPDILPGLVIPLNELFE